MGSAIRSLNMLSAVIMLAAAIYIQITFWLVLSQMVQSLMAVTVLVYFFFQIDLGSRERGTMTKATSVKKARKYS